VSADSVCGGCRVLTQWTASPEDRACSTETGGRTVKTRGEPGRDALFVFWGYITFTSDTFIVCFFFQEALWCFLGVPRLTCGVVSVGAVGSSHVSFEMAAPVLSAHEVFAEGVRAVLETWPVLQIAVDNGFGGAHSRQKADWMVDAVQQYFHDNS
uniref:Pre-rRNA-processing protein TSR2 homolog n=1 Tax=Lepisosteus oculatus TaxID=7918 RepID=W5NBA2_LEPOC